MSEWRDDSDYPLGGIILAYMKWWELQLIKVNESKSYAGRCQLNSIDAADDEIGCDVCEADIVKWVEMKGESE